jgi:hypothetical protein
MCAFLILFLLVFPIIAVSNFISVACILLSSLLVHVHVSDAYSSIVLSYTLYIVHLINVKVAVLHSVLVMCL